MGVSVYHISPYTFMMGMLWFSAFVLLGLVMRKLKYPIKFSLMPLVMLLIFSVLRMFLILPIPGTVLILSESIYPAIVNLARFEITPWLNILQLLIFVWIAVAIVLKVKRILLYKEHYRVAKLFVEFYPRDHDSEKIIAEIEGTRRPIQIYRTHSNLIFTAGFKPYVFLPIDLDFSDDDLRLALRHEWKHIQDRDYIATIIVNIICAAFWWNPMVYVLRSNVSFAQELKCDFFAANDKDRENYSNSINRLASMLGAQDDMALANAFIKKHDETADRWKTLSIHNKVSRGKRILTNVCFFVVTALLFVASYTFIVQPIFWEGYVDAVEYFSDDLYDVYRAVENFIIDNGDGTFSLFIDGQHVSDRDNIDDKAFAFLPILKCEDNEPRE